MSHTPLFIHSTETILIAFIIYLLFMKKNKSRTPELTEKDVDELIADWKPVSHVSYREIVSTAFTYTYYIGSIGTSYE